MNRSMRRDETSSKETNENERDGVGHGKRRNNTNENSTEWRSVQEHTLAFTYTPN